MRSATLLSLACAVVAAALSMGSSSALAPRTTPNAASPQSQAQTHTNTQTPEAFVVTRRSAIGSAIAVCAAATISAPGRVLAAEELSADEKAAAEAAREKMRQRIEASKKNYRKGADLVKQRKETTDYSCVAETGSPCPEKKE